MNTDTEQELLLSIDPGNTQSAFCFTDTKTYRPIYFCKENNESVKRHISDFVKAHNVKHAACEMIASYGMAVGASVFETCVFIGELKQLLLSMGLTFEFVYRKEEKMDLCGSMKAKDSNIRVALIDRFALHDKKYGRGTKDNPDWFRGFGGSDLWASYAVGIVWLDKQSGYYAQ